MSINTKAETLEFFREGAKMWEWFAENPHADKLLYSCTWPKSPLLNAKHRCAGCEEVDQDCSECRLLTEEEKKDASGPESRYPLFCCNGEYKKWKHYASSWTDKKIEAAKIAERHRKAVAALEQEGAGERDPLSHQRG